MERHSIDWSFDDVKYTFNTIESLFSFRQIDTGSIEMIKRVDLKEDSKVLDIGCGYGVVGIWAASKIGAKNVVMSDVNEEAVKMASENAKLNNVGDVKIIHSNGFKNIEDSEFTVIMSNPPYHTDFSVAKEFIEGSYKHLQMGGLLVMVTKRFDWYKNKIQSVFGGVKWVESEGYYIFMAEKRVVKKVNKDKKSMSKKLERKYKRKY
jgi:16S rRNA (guanine1207-N2)-methyltransferase